MNEFICNIDVLIDGRSVPELWDQVVVALANVEVTRQTGTLMRKLGWAYDRAKFKTEREVVERDGDVFEVLARDMRLLPGTLDPEWLTGDLNFQWHVDSQASAERVYVGLRFAPAYNRLDLGLVWEAEVQSSRSVAQAWQVISCIDDLWDSGHSILDSLGTITAGGKRPRFGDVKPPWIRDKFFRVCDAAQLEQSYDDPSVLRQLGLYRREVRAGRAYLIHMPTADNWYQWVIATRSINAVLARAAAAERTQHNCDWGFDVELLPELRDAYYQGAHHLSFGAYDHETCTLSYVARCAGPDDHLHSWEIHTLGRLLRHASSLVDLHIDAINVEFDDLDTAMRERRPLLDVGVQVFGPPDDAGLPRPIDWPVRPPKSIKSPALVSRGLCLQISGAKAESLEALRERVCERLAAAAWRPAALREETVVPRSSEVADRLRLPDPRPPQPTRRWSGDFGPFKLQIDAFDQQGLDLTVTMEPVTANDADFARCLASTTQVLESMIDEIEQGSVSRCFADPPCMPVPPLFRRSYACIVRAEELSRWYRDPAAVEAMPWQRWRRHNDKLFVARHLEVVNDWDWFFAFFEEQWTLAKAAKERQFAYSKRRILNEEEAEILAIGWTDWSLQLRVETNDNKKRIVGLDAGEQVTSISGAEIQAWMQLWCDRREPPYASRKNRSLSLWDPLPELRVASQEVAASEGPVFAHLGFRVSVRAAEPNMRRDDAPPVVASTAMKPDHAPPVVANTAMRRVAAAIARERDDARPGDASTAIKPDDAPPVVASTARSRALVLKQAVTLAIVGERLERAGWTPVHPDDEGDVRRWTRAETTAEYRWVQDHEFATITVSGGDWPEMTQALKAQLDVVSTEELRAEIRTNEVARILRALRMLEETGDIALIHEIMVLRRIDQYGIAEAAERAYRRCGVAAGMLSEDE